MSRYATVGLAAAIVFACGARTGSCAGTLRLWIEAEDFTSATKGVKIVSGDYAKLSAKEAQDGLFFLAKSQRDPEPNVRVSNSRYIVQTAGSRGVPTPSEAAVYEFVLPSAGDYYFWIRCDAPAGCNRYMNLWLDTLAARQPVHLLGFQHWGLWTWWPWGDVVNRGKAKSYSLAAGSHTLFLGDMDQGTMVDKILVTNDARYVPYGLGDSYYDATFESEEIIGAHNERGKPRYVESRATGWRPCPENAWDVREEGISGNHYYVRAGRAGDNDSTSTLSYSLIEGLECRLFTADLEVFPGAPSTTWDALLIYGFQDPRNYCAVQTGRSTVKVLHIREGETSIAASAETADLAAGRRRVRVARGRTRVRVDVDAETVLEAPLPLEESGSLGVGSHTEGVGFDNVRVSPSEEVDFHCDLGRSGSGRENWVRLRGESVAPWTTECTLEQGDTLLFDVPPWSGSEVAFTPSETWDGTASVLFPYVTRDRFLEIRMDATASGTIELIRHMGTQTTSLAKARTPQTDKRPESVAVTCVRGLVSVNLDGQTALEANEYDIVTGTIGFSIGESGQLPFGSMRARAKTIIVDTFPVLQGGGLMPDWKVLQGAWAVRTVMEGNRDALDGQLIASGPGELGIGDSTWRTYRIGLSALFEPETEFAFLGRVARDSAIEVLFDEHSVQVRRRVDDESIALQSTTLDAALSGWRRIEVVFGEETIAAEVDGKTWLRIPMQAHGGSVGLRNLGAYGLFDDLRIDVLATDAGPPPREQKADPAVLDIARDLLK